MSNIGHLPGENKVRILEGSSTPHGRKYGSTNLDYILPNGIN